jgi:hypothetical protein
MGLERAKQAAADGNFDNVWKAAGGAYEGMGRARDDFCLRGLKDERERAYMHNSAARRQARHYNQTDRVDHHKSTFLLHAGDTMKVVATYATTCDPKASALSFAPSMFCSRHALRPPVCRAPASVRLVCIIMARRAAALMFPATPFCSATEMSW